VLKIQVEVFAVSYEETGSELVALLKKVKKSRKTNLNTIEHSKSIFNGHYIRKWMRKVI
jgi:hypothetical protein